MRSLRSNCDETGAFVSIWMVIVTAGAFTILLGLVVDGGNTLAARRDAARTAEQAARVAADQLDDDSLRSGGADIAAAAAQTAAHRYLSSVDAHGSVQVSADTVTVTVTGQEPTQFLAMIGVESFAVHESATAASIDQNTNPGDIR